MTVHREISAELKLDIHGAADVVSDVLESPCRSYRYIDAEFNDSRTSVSATIRPNSPLLLSTQLLIEIEPVTNDCSKITARTQSQAFLFGDVFGFYDTYLNEFLIAVHNRATSA